MNACTDNKVFEIVKSFHFWATRQLIAADGTTKEMYGAGWKGRVRCKGPSGLLENDMLVPFGEINTVIAKLHEKDLNTVLNTTQPTVEYVAAWILDQVPFAVEVELAISGDHLVVVSHQQ